MATTRSKKPRQLDLHLPTWGGSRRGAGRKRSAERPQVPHVVRPDVRAHHPVLVTMRVREDVPDLRQPAAWAAIVRVLRSVRERGVLRIVHFTVLRNHLHLLAESDGRERLSLGMNAFATRLAKNINARFGRRGSFFAGRYHARELTTQLEVRHALRYVLLNARHHAAQAGKQLPASWIDRRSSAARFDGWREAPRVRHQTADFGTVPACTWLLRVGWRTHGLLALDDVPGPRACVTLRSSSTAPSPARRAS